VPLVMRTETWFCIPGEEDNQGAGRWSLVVHTDDLVWLTQAVHFCRRSIFSYRRAFDPRDRHCPRHNSATLVAIDLRR
jgi:hypothetical protein